jgi:hypothetical protein
MAKAAKDRPTAGKGAPLKAGGAKNPGSRPTQARKSTKAAPDTPAVHAPERETSANTAASLTPEEVYRLIQESAYFKAKARGFAPGHEVQDWIEAEQEVRRRLESRA